MPTKTPSKGSSKQKKRPQKPSRSALLQPQHKLDERKDAAALESRFLRLPPELAEYWKTAIVQKPFERPIPAEAHLLTRDMVDGEADGAPRLTIPKRPKWNYSATKEYVEKNEEGMFRRWLIDLDAMLKGGLLDEEGRRYEPTLCERNLETYRQVWRTTEASDIICMLADAQAPLLHLPASLLDYVTTLKPAKPLILVLTKADLVSPEAVAAWVDYFRREMADMQVVPMKSYLDPAKAERRHQCPGTDDWHLVTFVAALKRAHEQLCTPHPRVASDPERLAAWKPRVVERVDWEALLGESKSVDAAKPAPGDGSRVKPYLSVGLIGQPNVGKSSLLNAILGRKVVRASATPGKTKHLQSIFAAPDLRLVDCPGLVSPSRAGLRMQVMAGVVTRQATEAVIALVSRYMPLETILGFPQCSTTDALLTAFAESRSYVTAKAGRADTARAAAEILRFLQNAQWSFWPPGSTPPSSTTGIFMAPSADLEAEQSDAAETEDEGSGHPTENSESEADTAGSDIEDDVSEGSSSDEGNTTSQPTSKFALLSLDEGDA